MTAPIATLIDLYAASIYATLKLADGPRDVRELLKAQEKKGARYDDGVKALDRLVDSGRVRYVLTGPIAATPSVEAIR